MTLKYSPEHVVLKNMTAVHLAAACCILGTGWGSSETLSFLVVSEVCMLRHLDYVIPVLVAWAFHKILGD